MYFRPDKGIDLMQSRECDWTDNGSLNCHVWWHQALNYVQKGDHEQALQIYDNKVRPLAFKSRHLIIFIL